jgi:2'-5' RNA ligase
MPTIIGCQLPDPYYSAVTSVRGELVETFGVDEYANPFPHFTLYALDDAADVSAVVTAVEEAAADRTPFSVHTDGIGLFPQNVVWIPVAKSPRLSAFQSAVARAVDDLGTPPVPYYEPHRWFPHVGVAVGEDATQASDIVEFLLDYDFDWDFTVDTVTITRPPSDGAKYERVASIDL